MVKNETIDSSSRNSESFVILREGISYVYSAILHVLRQAPAIWVLSLIERDPDAIRRVAVKALGRLSSEWSLTGEVFTMLLGVSREKLRSEKLRTDGETLVGSSLILGICKATNILFPSSGRAAEFLRLPNTALNGESTMDVMLKGSIDDLYEIRRFPDA